MARDDELSERIAALPPEKRALFLRQLKQRKQQASESIPCLSRDQAHFALSPGQERLWFIHQLQPGSPVYNLSFAIRIQGQLNLDALAASLRALVQRHESLRTAIRQVNGQPVQVIVPEAKLDLPVTDLSVLDEAARQERLEAMIYAEAQRPFDLSQAPLLRASLIRVAAEDALLLMTAHHIVFDGWSAGIFHRDLWTLYDAICLGSTPALPELTVQYVDFAAWQRDRANSAAMKSHLEYWKTQLSDLPLTEVPTDLPRPAMHTFAGARETRALPAAFTHALRGLAEQQGVTLFMLALAAFKTLVFRYSGQRDLVIGTPVAERMRGELENIVGFLVNTMALRTRIEGAPSFRAFLQSVRQTALDAYAHQEMPFAQLVDALQTGRDASRSPLFQLMFALRDNPAQTYASQQAIQLSPQEIRSQTSQFDLTLEIVAGEDGLQMAIDYRTDLYHPSTIQRMLAHYENLLRSILADPDRSLPELEMLGADEKHLLLKEWNTTETDYIPECVHTFFEQQVERTPDAPALVVSRNFADLIAFLGSSNFNPAAANILSGVYTPLSTGEREQDFVASTVAAEKQSQYLPTLAKACFRKHPLVFIFPHASWLKAAGAVPGAEAFDLLSVPASGLVAANLPVLRLLEWLDGTRTLDTIANLAGPQEYRLAYIGMDQSTGTLHTANVTSYQPDGSLDSWVPLIRAMATAGMIEWHAYRPQSAVCNDAPLPVCHAEHPESPVSAEEAASILPDYCETTPDGALSPVLLVGSTTGSGTVGLMYLASYLRRHGIEAFCQLNDIHLEKEALKANIHRLIDKTHPRLVAVSLKWFPHMARALEICRLIKEYAPGTKVALGGDTSGYFAEDLIQYEAVDYIVTGDGELPLLKICQGSAGIPNCTYKRDGQIVRSPVSYLHSSESLRDVYLTHLDEIFVSPADLSLTPYLFIFTGRGCPMNCHYCGGARDVQASVPKRPKPYFTMRDVREIRNDIVRLKPHTSTFLFDFDLPGYDSFDLYQSLWRGIDLTCHHGYFYFWELPTTEFIDLVARTFGFVSLNIDVNSLSERHRQCLTKAGAVKPQPNDAEILAFFERCEQYPNVRTTVNLINGLPFFNEEDIQSADAMLEHIIQHYKSFEGLGWGRLHAQPGAPITKDYAGYGMQPSAQTFEDFHSYSKRNLAEQQYPNLPSLHYPFIYYQDETLNARVTKYYVDTMQKLRDLETRSRRKQQFFNEKMTYRELDQAANRLANSLIQQGLQPEQRVGICLERSKELVIAALAVFKTGGAYVPLEPTYPIERLRFMVQDAQVALLLTTSHLAHSLALPVERTLCLDAEWPTIMQEADTAPNRSVTPDQLAYVLYTSGSTGQPKGVMVEHRGVGNLARAQSKAFGVEPGTRVLQFAPFCFDASVSEIFVTLLSGGTLCMASQDQLMPGPDLVELLHEQAVNVLTCPPSVWATLPADRFPALRTVVSAGEACPPDLVERWALPGRRFINAYGPTETTVCATLTECQPSGEPPAIGRPIDNTRVYLLDAHRQLVPIGMPGELYVSGVGLARGYWNRPNLSAESFVANPFEAETQMYRTGDLARWRIQPDGSAMLEFLGRGDQQVKIRGSRVEIGEIEAALAQHANVRQCVVTAHQTGSETRLSAYWLPRDLSMATQTGELRAFLKNRLPDYMLPYAFIRLEALPLLPNGKIDARALPQLDCSRPDLEDSYTAPRDAVEALLASIWAESLRLEAVGIEDNFFALGGHSLLITQVLAQIADIFQVELPARVFLDSPTVAGLAVELRRRETTPGLVETIAQLHQQIRQMSADEVGAILSQKKQAGGNLS